MNIELIQSILTFLGGLGMFIYGRQIMANGLQQAAGEKTKHMIEVMTKTLFRGILVGAVVTALIQSSGATTVMVIGFVNAHLMNLSQAVGVIMGANIGTTVAAWLVSLNEWGAFLAPDSIAPVLMISGVILSMITKSDRFKEISNILIGFGILFIGLSAMSGAVTPYADNPIFVEAFVWIGGNPLLGIIIGAIVTAIMQSSAASMGILQVLAMTGVVNWGSAVFIALGQNIGTCAVGLISAIGADTNAKRAAYIHLEFNVIGSILIGALALIFFMFVPAAVTASVTSTGLAVFHTLFNVVATIALFPMAGLLVKISKFIVRDKDEQEEQHLVHMDERLLKTPQIALNTINAEINFMGHIALENIEYSRDCLILNDHYEKLHENEEKLNHFYSEITRFLEHLNTEKLTERERMQVKHAFLALRDIEHIGDRCAEIAEISQKYINYKDFSDHTKREINSISHECYRALELALDLRSNKSPSLVERVNDYEDKVDHLETLMKEGRIAKLLKNKSNVANGIIFLEAVDCYERIADHAKLLAHYIALEEGYEDIDPGPTTSA